MIELSKERIRQIIKEEVAHANTQSNEGLRMQKHLTKMVDLAGTLIPHFEEDDDVEEWIQEKVAVICALLQSIHDYKKYENVRSK
tara:strand:+ start:6483 stop:6737 length:255 start_codon:yes stop_codon:yes gene_type:complete